MSAKPDEPSNKTMMPELRFKDRVALIAGGTGALGRAVAAAFSREGARVVVTYRRQSEFDQFLSESKLSPQDVKGAMADATDAASVARMIESIVANGGSLDIVVNTIGGYHGGKKIWEEDLSSYEEMMSLNLKAGFVLARAAIPVMIRQNRGWIVNVASRAAYGNSPGAALYSASKAGAVALFDSLADEVKSYPINVNSVVPSIFDTPANRRAMPAADYVNWPKPEEIADVILFLCSQQARIIHGAAIPVYGRT
jgi:NAD(P)-dependent dehydrogenase (short-subunit alcohol dehydrogenase family)